MQFVDMDRVDDVYLVLAMEQASTMDAFNTVKVSLTLEPCSGGRQHAESNMERNAWYSAGIFPRTLPMWLINGENGPLASMTGSSEYRICSAQMKQM